MELDNTKRMVLTAKRIGVTEDDVANCTKIYTLLNWKIELAKDIENISMQLSKRRVDAEKNSDTIDESWKLKAQSSINLLRILGNKMDIRVAELRETKNDFAERFMESARLFLKNDTFQEIIEYAEQQK